MMEGKKVLITGASGGIGQALVRQFSQAGSHIIACDKDKATLDVFDDSDHVRGKIVFDLLDSTSINQAVTKISHEFGVPDCIINNAGATHAERLEAVNDKIIEDELALNLGSVMRFTQGFLPSMKKTGGVIIFISSINGLQHFCDPVYSAAKAGIAAYARAIAVEYGCYNIRANVVAPGSTRTPAWDWRFERDPKLAEKVAALFPLQRMVSVDEVAQAVFFLASPLASGITGVTLPVDAGAMAGSLPFINTVTKSVS